MKPSSASLYFMVYVELQLGQNRRASRLNLYASFEIAPGTKGGVVAVSTISHLRFASVPIKD
jgi:hypothetical protein